MTGRRTWTGLLVAGLLAAVLWWVQGDGTGTSEDPSTSSSSSLSTDGSDLAVVALDDLPPEAADAVGLIDDGGPFLHDQDDGVFGNREGLLPDKPEGFYREYTVETPGSDDRAARRIVAGEDGALYWTDDHYASFSLIER